MIDSIDSYLLPCSCGRSLVVRPRQAGETLHCECGQERVAPSMVEIRHLTPAARPAERAAAASQTKWGVSQRLLLAGLVVLLLAGVLATVLAYGQYTYNRGFDAWLQRQHDGVRGLRPWSSIVFFRQQLAPGIDTPVETRYSEQRQRLAFGMVVAMVAGTVGMILSGIGVAGMVTKKSGSS